MIRGLSDKKAVFSLQKLQSQYNYYTSNERVYFSLSTGVLDYKNIHKSTKLFMKKLIFDLYFSIVHISINVALNYLKF